MAVLEWILDSSLCSKSTANLIFWQSLPSYFEESDFNDQLTCPKYCDVGFLLIKKILDMYDNNDFSPIDIKFSPHKVKEKVRRKNPHWNVPKGISSSIDGLKIKVL